MNTRAASLLSLAAAATLAGGVPVGARILRPARQTRQKESIDDVLRRARERQGKAHFDPSLDGTVRR